MNCDEDVELVTVFLDGALESDVALRFLEHVELCGACDAYRRNA